MVAGTAVVVVVEVVVVVVVVVVDVDVDVVVVVVVVVPFTRGSDSNAPMSSIPSWGRLIPRWSAVRLVAPMLMALEPGSRA